MKKNLTLIKLGGSIITDKEVFMSLRKATLSRLVGEIASARQENPQQMLIIGHGQGGFAHVPATKYQTMAGFINEESRLGMAVVQDTAATLNRLVVHEFIKHELFDMISIKPEGEGSNERFSPSQDPTNIEHRRLVYESKTVE